MKKITGLFLSVAMGSALLAGCSSTTDDTTTAATTTTAAAEEETTTQGETDASAVKTGLAIITNIDDSKDATADEDGLAQIYSTVVAVTVDADGKIVACEIDAAQTKINFDAEGKITTDLTADVKTKQELGADYGMASSSGIGKEWNEQADAFAAYVVGKTADEVSGIAVSDGYAADEDLLASVTIHVTDFIAGVEKAVENAEELGASSADQLGIAVSTSLSNSADATAEEDGVAQAYSYYAAVTVDADGVITSCAIDASQGEVDFDAAGVITTDLTAEVQTKQELGADYGMASSSSIGKEWNEQADAFAAYVTGKTLDEVEGIAINDEGYAGDEDLYSSVTVHIGSFVTVVSKAVANAE